MTTLRRIHRLALPSLALLLLAAPACDRGGDEPAAGGGADAAIERAVDGAAAPKDVKDEVKSFLKDQRKKGCEMLPPAMVAEVLAVPEGELKQMKIMGCNYSWESADEQQIAEASIMSIWIKKDAAAARKWFENSTKTQTAEELKAAMAMVKAKAKESKEVDTEVKEKAVDQLGDAVTGMFPEGGIKYEDVAGVGDAARVDENEGALTVLVGNMVFNVRAYKGPPAPPPDMSAMTSGDVKKMMKASKEASAKWMAETRDEREKLAIALAKAIVAKL